MLMLNILPLPRNSLIEPITVRESVNPSPIPKPSRAESKTEFLAANASARPSTIQFTTISGINKPKLSEIAGAHAFKHNSTIVTNEAMITMYAGIRTLSGINFFTSEITVFEHNSTLAVARPIPMPLIAEVVVASVGHIPSRRTNVGFSFKMPLNNICNFFMSN